MLNIAWSVLVRGQATGLAQCRRVTPTAYKADPAWSAVLDTLVPDYRAVTGLFRVEQLVQLVLRSSLRERLLAYDPINTYEKALIAYPSPGLAHTCPLPLFFTDSSRRDVSFAYSCMLSPLRLTWLTPDGVVAYTVTDGLTSHLPLSYDKTIRLRGPFPLAVYQLDVAYTPKLEMDWQALLVQLKTCVIPWQDNDLRAIWQGDFSWVEQLAAVVQEVVEANGNVIS